MRTWPTRREAAEEAGRVVRAFGPEARVVLLVACPAAGPWLARRSPMLIDLVNAAHPALLVAGTAAYVAALLWVMAHDVERLRWRREFSGWQTVLRDRVARSAPPATPVLGSGWLARRRWHRTYGCGWRSVQRDRVARRRWDRRDAQ